MLLAWIVHQKKGTHAKKYSLFPRCQFSPKQKDSNALYSFLWKNVRTTLFPKHYTILLSYHAKIDHKTASVMINSLHFLTIHQVSSLQSSISMKTYDPPKKPPSTLHYRQLPPFPLPPYGSAHSKSVRSLLIFKDKYYQHNL